MRGKRGARGTARIGWGPQVPMPRWREETLGVEVSRMMCHHPIKAGDVGRKRLKGARPHGFAHLEGKCYRKERGRTTNNQAGFPTIVCLCGSTRFSETFHEANLRETLAGRIVLSIGCDFKSDADLMLAGQLSPADKLRLDELHLRKIDIADEVLVLNVGGYVGESTRNEIAYAEMQEKRIRYLEPLRTPEKARDEYNPVQPT